MEKKEYYKHNLPHFQQPGQAYFVTWSLQDTVPKKVLKRYTQQLEVLKSRIDAGAADSPRVSLHGDPPFTNRRSESATPMEPADSPKGITLWRSADS